VRFVDTASYTGKNGGQKQDKMSTHPIFSRL
jgi:hypothetical protein